MSHLNIISAWKDEEYRRSLGEAESALLPPHPAGLIELTDADMDGIGGGIIWTTITPHTPTITVTIGVIFDC